MSAYSLPGYDLWKQTDPSDDGSQEAIEQIECELARDADEVAEAVSRCEVPEELLAAAFLARTDAAWAALRAEYEARVVKELADRAVDVFNARLEEARICAHESRWEDAA